MATQISCGATDCSNNSRTQKPMCTLPMVRISKGQMGGAICFQYSESPVADPQTRQKSTLAPKAPSAAQGIGGLLG